MLLKTQNLRAEVGIGKGILPRSAGNEYSEKVCWQQIISGTKDMAYTHMLVCQHCTYDCQKWLQTSFLVANMMMAMECQRMPKLIAKNMALQQPTRHGNPWVLIFLWEEVQWPLSPYMAFSWECHQCNVVQFLGNWSPMAFGKLHRLGAPHTWSCWDTPRTCSLVWNTSGPTTLGHHLGPTWLSL